MKTKIIFLTGLMIMLMSSLAFAQNGSAGEETDVLEALLLAAKNGQWLVVAGFVLSGVIWVVRKVVAPKVKFFGTDFGGMLLAFGVAALSAVVGMLVEGMPVDVTSVAMAALTAGLLAVGGWSGVLKNLPWFKNL